MADDTPHIAAALPPDQAWPGFVGTRLPSLDVTAAVEAEARSSKPREPGREFAELRGVLSRILSSLDPDEALRQTLVGCMRITGASTGSIWLNIEGREPLRAVYAGFTHEYVRRFEALAAEGHPELLEFDRAVTIRRLVPGSGAPEAMIELAGTLGVRSSAELPLHCRGMHLGAVTLGHADVDAFERLSEDFLCTLTDLVAAALDNARLFEQAQVTQRRSLAERALQEQMLLHVDARVALLEGPELRILQHNPAFATGFPGGPDLTGRSWPSLLPGFESSAVQRCVARALQTRASQTEADVEVPWPGPGTSWWTVRATPLQVAGDESPRLVVTVHDVTERHELEDRLRHAQKMEAVGTLAGGIAHEYNNLLTAVLGNVSLALLDLPAGDRVVPGLRDAETAAQRAAELTRQLLGFGRRSPARLRPADLRGVVTESLRLLEHALDPRIVIETDFASDLWPVRADAAQIGQVVVNLSVNARDAMPEGGRLSLSLSNLRGRDRGGLGEHVVLEVRDTGEGMAPETLARMFEPFFTTKGPDRGTGLGLAVVHGIVEQHGGWVECQSTLGAGTAFRVHLPRYAGASADAGVPPGAGEIVLVVDDEEPLRDLARALLERLGYRVLTARDGVEAIAVVREARGRVDLVLLDLTMPRLSGRETLRELRAQAPGVIVVLMSGYPSADGPSAELQGDADGFLPKPYPPELLARVLREALDSKV